MSRLRQVWRAVRPFAALAAGVFSTLQLAPAVESVTIVLSVQQKASNLSIAVLKQELAAIPDLDLNLKWLRSENLTTGIELDRPIQVRLAGRCSLAGTPAKASRQPGPYAWAHVSDGRALARIIAHELHHVVHSEIHHSQEGLAQPRLTAASLIRGDARLYSGVNND